jgi:hypothetical protein
VGGMSLAKHDSTTPNRGKGADPGGPRQWRADPGASSAVTCDNGIRIGG